MFDPMTVVFDMPNIFTRKIEGYGGRRYWRPLITVWHKDPCKDGTDSSCQHHYRNRKLNQYEKALAEIIWDGEPIFDNAPHYPHSREHRWFQSLKESKYAFTARRTIFRIPWQWHLWHWRLQVHPVQGMKRWLFSRCHRCGGGFRWNEVVVGTAWESTGPLWFRSEHHIYHDSCLAKLRAEVEREHVEKVVTNESGN